jgi:hypothetical protein
MPPDANPDLLQYTMVIRDFRGHDLTPPGHPDFEQGVNMSSVGMVQATLVNGTPALSGTHPTIASAASFAQWYVDDSTVNIRFEDPIALPRTFGKFTYDNPSFFPLDSRGYPALTTCGSSSTVTSSSISVACTLR